MAAVHRCEECPRVVHGRDLLEATLKLEGHQETHDPESPVLEAQKELCEP